ncbi:phosphopeptide-binding protein [candidate division FCPU426 bacterium]|nr:phosphopeptide-binding protein [candidate division FCPU426 bacterium]
MKYKLKVAALIMAMVITMAGCGQQSAPNKEMSMGGLKLAPVTDSPEYPDAKLTLLSPAAGATLQPGMNRFVFKVEGFKLGVQTPGAAGKGIANSDKGQHIHFILNNGPYAAYYTNAFEHELPAGHYVLLAFLSRSNHESVKNPNAFVFTQFDVGEKQPQNRVNLGNPHLIYSRPKGTYQGKESKNIILDFYLLNAALSPRGNRVIATINNTPFTLTEWRPYIISGMPMGENTVSLKLADSQGNLIPGPFNETTRTIILE